MKKLGTREVILATTALLMLFPRKICAEHRVDENGKRKISRFAITSTLFGVDVGDAGDGKKSISLSILPESETIGGKLQELIDTIQEKKKEKQLRPLFKSALELVSKRNTVDADYLCRKLGVGQSCGEAFIEMMEEMGVVESADDGKYRVIMPKKKIDALMNQ